MTGKHSSSPGTASGAAPDLEYTVLLQRCWSRSGTSWWVFAKISSWWFSSPPVSQVSGLTSEISPASFFSQFSSIWAFLKFDYPQFYVWFFAHQRGSVRGYSSSSLTYLISLSGSFLNRPEWFTSAVPRMILLVYSTTIQLYVLIVFFTPRQGSRIILRVWINSRKKR